MMALKEQAGGKPEFRALIVDDEPDLREAIAARFRLSGFTVEVASSGNEAYEILNKNPVDVVVSDIRMPNGTGVDLLEKIQKIENRPKAFILITGYADVEEKAVLEMGADRLIPKPFDSRNLIEQVLSILAEPDEKKKNLRISTAIKLDSDSD